MFLLHQGKRFFPTRLIVWYENHYCCPRIYRHFKATRSLRWAQLPDILYSSVNALDSGLNQSFLTETNESVPSYLQRHLFDVEEENVLEFRNHFLRSFGDDIEFNTSFRCPFKLPLFPRAPPPGKKPFLCLFWR